MVQRDYKTVNKPRKIVNDDGKMGCLLDIAFGKDGVWAVADSNNCVYIFDDQETLIRKFGQSGTNNGQFQRPWGISFDANNDLYVTDYNNHRVQKFNINGTYLFQFGHCGSGNGQLSYPQGIAVHNDKVFVADYGNCRISVFHLNGQFGHVIGSGQLLSRPWGVAVTTNDQLLVADFNKNYIVRFTLDGTYVDQFGNGYLSHPAAVTTDLNGFVLVGEEGNQHISVFNKDGVFIYTFGSRGSAVGQFSSPYGIAISPSNEVHVADFSNKRVQIF
ncbi:E3 ubiquitin-protein ligase TRIM71-like [Dysidea avara]|uniref:E3 ubiquitin-protein ligase TRIM71-like n=1 Tax=Dysidea avara TaxID=196820 RepID=UPI00332AA1C7